MSASQKQDNHYDRGDLRDRYLSRVIDPEAINVRRGYVVVNVMISGCIFLILLSAIDEGTAANPSSSVVLALTALQLVCHIGITLWREYQDNRILRMRRKVKDAKLFDYRYDPVLDYQTDVEIKRTFFLDDDGEG
jgi:hypothetical protein